MIDDELFDIIPDCLQEIHSIMQFLHSTTQSNLHTNTKINIKNPFHNKLIKTSMNYNDENIVFCS